MYLVHAIAVARRRAAERDHRPYVLDGKAPAHWRIRCPSARLIAHPPLGDPRGPTLYTALRTRVGIPGESPCIRTRSLADLLAWVARELPRESRGDSWQLESLPFAVQVETALATINLTLPLPAAPSTTKRTPKPDH